MEKLQHPGEDLESPMSEFDKADGFLEKGDWKRAIDCYDHLMTSLSKDGCLISTMGQKVVILLMKIAKAAEDNDDIDEAINYYEEVLDTLREIHGEDDPHNDILRVLQYLIDVCGKSSKSKMAVSYMQELLRLKKILHNNEPHQDIADLYNCLGVAWRETDPDKAVKYHFASLAVSNRLYDGEVDRDVLITTYTHLADAWGQYGDFYKKGAYYKEVYEMQKTKYDGKPNTCMIESLKNFADACINVQNASLAKESLDEAMLLDKQIHGVNEENKSLSVLMDRLRDIAPNKNK